MFYESVRLMHDLADSIIKMRKMELSDKKEESSFENKNTDSILQDRKFFFTSFLLFFFKYQESVSNKKLTLINFNSLLFFIS